MKYLTNLLLLLTPAAMLLSGCAHPRITAVDIAHPDVKIGMPYYMPKAYLIVTKNVRYIPTPTVGLTQTVPIPNVFDASFGPGGGGSPSNKVSSPPTNNASKTNKNS